MVNSLVVSGSKVYMGGSFSSLGDQSRSNFAAVKTVGSLPVELTAFTVTPQEAAVRLAWATASEKNSAHFEVERSTAGKAFVAIGEVAAAAPPAPTRCPIPSVPGVLEGIYFLQIIWR